MKRRLMAILALTMILALAASCSQTQSPPAATTAATTAQSTASAGTTTETKAEIDVPAGLNIKIGHSVSTEHGYHLGLLKFKEIVEAKTNGKVTVAIHASSSLGSEREMIEGIQLGTIDMALAATSQLTSFEPKMQLFDLPFLFKNRKHAFGVLDGEIGKEMLQLLEKKGMVGLAYFEVGFRDFTNNIAPIKTPADIAGKKFRLMQTPVHVETIAHWGGNPTSMPIGEVYTALQTKTIDGQENPLSIIKAQRLFEVQKYISITEHFYTGTPLLIQKKMWDSYSAGFQAVLQEAANAGRDVCRDANMKSEETALAEFKAAGCEINDADKQAFMNDCQAIYDKFAPEIGQELIDRVIASGKDY